MITQAIPSSKPLCLVSKKLGRFVVVGHSLHHHIYYFPNVQSAEMWRQSGVMYNTLSLSYIQQEDPERLPRYAVHMDSAYNGAFTLMTNALEESGIKERLVKVTLKALYPKGEIPRGLKDWILCKPSRLSRFLGKVKDYVSCTNEPDTSPDDPPGVATTHTYESAVVRALRLALSE
eukprot:GHVO01041050.1.p2 GENE.GHVO01041050.1~~GHVO01041050.1.p2  ORF type:complete len:176 (+),score=20.17 GHVO01041050.1:484-1011(+)